MSSGTFPVWVVAASFALWVGCDGTNSNEGVFLICGSAGVDESGLLLFRRVSVELDGVPQPDDGRWPSLLTGDIPCEDCTAVSDARFEFSDFQTGETVMVVEAR